MGRLVRAYDEVVETDDEGNILPLRDETSQTVHSALMEVDAAYQKWLVARETRAKRARAAGVIATLIRAFLAKTVQLQTRLRT